MTCNSAEIERHKIRDQIKAILNTARSEAIAAYLRRDDEALYVAMTDDNSLVLCRMNDGTLGLGRFGHACRFFSNREACERRVAEANALLDGAEARLEAVPQKARLQAQLRRKTR